MTLTTAPLAAVVGETVIAGLICVASQEEVSIGWLGPGGTGVVGLGPGGTGVVGLGPGGTGVVGLGPGGTGVVGVGVFLPMEFGADDEFRAGLGIVEGVVPGEALVTDVVTPEGVGPDDKGVFNGAGLCRKSPIENGSPGMTIPATTATASPARAIRFATDASEGSLFNRTPMLPIGSRECLRRRNQLNNKTGLGSQPRL